MNDDDGDWLCVNCSKHQTEFENQYRLNYLSFCSLFCMEIYQNTRAPATPAANVASHPKTPVPDGKKLHKMNCVAPMQVQE